MRDDLSRTRSLRASLMALALTTLELVRAKKPDLSGGFVDEALNALIASVSQEAEDLMNRHTLAERRTEIIELASHQTRYWLPGYPVSSVVSVKYGSSPIASDFAAIQAMTPGTDYAVLNDKGTLILRSITYWYDPAFIQITYTGGMAADTAEFIANYPHLADVVANEIVNRFNRRSGPDGSTTTNDVGSVTSLKQLGNLGDFEKACGRRTRRTRF